MKMIYLSIFACVCALTGFAQTATTDPGVVINGVTWATRNVDAPGTFATMPESYGMFYQWNRPKAWASTGQYVNNWDNQGATGTEWEAKNDPSPSGWRVPTLDEIKFLLDKEKVTSEKSIVNGKNGRKFIDKTNGNSIFLPDAGYRGNNGALYGTDVSGNYWSSTQNEYNSAYHVFFNINSPDVNWYSDYRYRGYSVRSVSTNSSAVENVKADELQISVVGNLLSFKNLTGLENTQIYDISGRNVELLYTTSLSNGTQTINISHLPAGVYIVKVGNHTKKIVKQ